MKKGIVIACALAGLTASAQAGLKDYSQARKELGIVQAVSSEALMTFVGELTMEIEGRITGFVGGGGVYSLVLEREDGAQLAIRTDEVPRWLAPPMQVRLIVKASRPTDSHRITADLIAVADVVVGRKADAAMAPKAPTAPAPKPAPAGRPAGSGASRSGDGRAVRPAEAPVPSAFAAFVPAYSSYIRGFNSKISQAAADRIAETIIRYSIRFGVDARLVMALVMTESGFNPNARSHAGARGLGQLMPGTARMLGVSNSYDTEENLFGTVKLLRQHLDKYNAKTGDEYRALVLALAAYNAGPGAVSRHGGVPPYRETQNYVKKVTERYRELSGQ
jgi:soluble lytic murein transglycosylase-like protein